MIGAIVQRPCDGQPNRMCPSDCDVDCDFNNARLDRAMNAPIRPMTESEFVPDAEPESNHPWDWLARFGFWWACGLVGFAYGIGYGAVALIKRFFN